MTNIAKRIIVRIKCIGGIGGNPFLSLIAGESITSYMAVAVIDGMAFKFDTGNEEHYGKCVGLAMQSVSAGEELKVKESGKIQNFAWGLTKGEQYYVNDIAEITTIKPSVGILQPIGIALETDLFLVKIEDSTIEV